MHIIMAGPAFIDTKIALQEECGYNDDGTVCILGAWELSYRHTIAEYKSRYNKVIVFNQEQIRTKMRKFMHIGYYAMLKEADEVWDYDDYNIDALRNIRSDIKLHLLKPCNKLVVKYNNNTPDIDVLFYGAMNDHRTHIINQLRKYKINVATPEVFGDDLNTYIARAKICLNVHFYTDTALQEQARMIRWISSKSNIISEISRTNYMNIPEYHYTQLIDAIMSKLGK